MNNKILVIAGPTASGKTALSIQLAKKLGGEIVSADSMQIYQYMNIGSAKPDEAEKSGIPHYLMDVVKPTEEFSVAQYVSLAKSYINDILSRQKIPVVVGGTGLYITSLVDNVEFVEAKVDTALRESLYRIAEEHGNEYLHDMLTEIDPEAASWIHPNNVKRVVRAIEVFRTSGITLTEQNKLSKSKPSPYLPVMIALTTDRAVLYDRINRRVKIMMDSGLIEEVARLKEMGCRKDMQSMQGIGYKEVFDYLEGALTVEECTELICKNTRNYAKRQLTWFKRDDRYHWLDSLDADLLGKSMEIWNR